MIPVFNKFLDYNFKGKRILWKDMTKGRRDSQHFNNFNNAQTPFIVLGEMLLDCQHGKDRNEVKKAKYKEKKENKKRVRALTE